MTAGLPGAGIGGLFYLVSALLMPVRELVGKLRDPRAPRRWALAFKQAGIALGIVVMLWVTGWAIARLLAPTSAAAALLGRVRLATGSANVVQLAAVLLSFGTLLCVLVAVQVARLVVAVRGDRPCARDVLRDTVPVAHSLTAEWSRPAAMVLVVALGVVPARSAAQDGHRTPRAVVEPTFGWSGDSDGNRTERTGAALDVAVNATTHAGVAVDAARTSDAAERVSLFGARGTVAWVPNASWLVQASGGATTIGAVGAVPSATEPVGSLRTRWRSADRRASVDGRVARSLLDATPTLVINRVVRNEVTGRADVPLAGALRARVLGRYGTVTSAVDDNHRTVIGVGPVVALRPSVELNASAQRVTFAHASAAGYFAPERVYLAEVGTYSEFESDWSGAVLALDAGAGAQQVTEFGAAQGRWRPALRLWSQLTYPVRRGTSLLMEVDAYSASAGAAVATTPEWRALAVRAGARVAL